MEATDLFTLETYNYVADLICRSDYDENKLAEWGNNYNLRPLCELVDTLNIPIEILKQLYDICKVLIQKFEETKLKEVTLIDENCCYLRESVRILGYEKNEFSSRWSFKSKIKPSNKILVTHMLLYLVKKDERLMKHMHIKKYSQCRCCFICDEKDCKGCKRCSQCHNYINSKDYDGDICKDCLEKIEDESRVKYCIKCYKFNDNYKNENVCKECKNMEPCTKCHKTLINMSKDGTMCQHCLDKFKWCYICVKELLDITKDGTECHECLLEISKGADNADEKPVKKENQLKPCMICKTKLINYEVDGNECLVCLEKIQNGNKNNTKQGTKDDTMKELQLDKPKKEHCMICKKTELNYSKDGTECYDCLLEISKEANKADEKPVKKENQLKPCMICKTKLINYEVDGNECLDCLKKIQNGNNDKVTNTLKENVKENKNDKNPIKKESKCVIS